MDSMISKNYTYAIVGASNDETKYGYRVLRDLLGGGYKAVPINLNEETILGQKVYHKLADYPGKFDVVVTIVPPAITLEIAKQAINLGIIKFWMQPGSESAEVIEFCEDQKMEYSVSDCIMVMRHYVE